MKKQLLFAVFAMICLHASSQEIHDSTWWFYFSNKDNTGYEISHPEKFLTQRSIDRRAWQNLGIDHTDLPVNATYVDSLKALGLDVLFTSKWLNGTLIQSTDFALIDTLAKYDFIQASPWETQTDEVYFPPKPTGERFAVPYATDPEYSYGLSFEQVNQIGIDHLHGIGYTGKGVIISVLDAGFINMTELSSFQNAYTNNQILETKDFVYNNPNVYYGHTHGTHVSSTIISQIPDTLIGTAPDASLILARTENPDSETRIEEYSWIAAAEWADSLGTDIINTSLGYYTFDNPKFDYSYDDLNGKTAHISIANSMTASKGILSVTSAGNEGNDPWFHIGVPADATDILSVGAVDAENLLADFSSRGPSADQRIKPEIAARGSKAILQSTNGSIAAASGTSFSSPIMAGASATLWQAYPEVSAKELINWIIQAGNQYDTPDNETGYGIPNMAKAYYAITSVPSNQSLNLLNIYPNPFTNELHISLQIDEIDNYDVKLYDLSGRVLHQKKHALPGSITLNENLPAGMYILIINNQNNSFKTPVIKK